MAGGTKTNSGLHLRDPSSWFFFLCFLCAGKPPQIWQLMTVNFLPHLHSALRRLEKQGPLSPPFHQDLQSKEDLRVPLGVFASIPAWFYNIINREVSKPDQVPSYTV